MQGMQGYTGDFGSQGPQGLQGLQGFQGIQGSNAGQGVQGLQGSQGYVFDGGVERTVTSVIIGAAATDRISANYTVGYVDVFLNGSKLDSSEYTATNGSSIIFTEDPVENDIIETIAYERVSLGSITGITTSSAYTLVSTDAGKFVNTSDDVIIPQNVFNEGDIISVYNNSGATFDVVQGSGTTVYLGGVGSTGNKTLSQKGLATILCVGTNKFVIVGAGVV